MTLSKDTRKKMNGIKLSTKVSLMVTAVLTVVLVALVLISSTNAANSLEAVINSEFNGISTQNGAMAQSIIDSATITAASVEDYIEEAFKKEATLTAEERAVKKKSNILSGTDISGIGYEVELYIIGAISAAMRNDDLLFGGGVFFEPYSVEAGIKNYNMYGDGNGLSLFGKYEDYASMEYYTVPKSTLKPWITTPYIDDGHHIVSASYPIVIDGEFLGVVIIDIEADQFAKIKISDAKYPTMSAKIVTHDLVIVYDSKNPEASGQNTASSFKNEAEYKKVMELTQTKKEPFNITVTGANGVKEVRYYYPIKAGNETWWSITALQQSDLQKDVKQLSGIMMIMLVAAVIITGACVVVTLRKMLKPINGLVAVATEIAGGNFDVEINVNSKDEIGMLSLSFHQMTESLRAIIGDISYNLGEMARGNFDVSSRCEEKYLGQYQTVLSDMKNINDRLTQALFEIQQAASQVSQGAAQISDGAQNLATGSTEQAATIEEFSATITEIQVQAESSSQLAMHAKTVTDQADVHMTQSVEDMNELTNAMTGINKSSQEIEKVIKVIDDIAFQTNILALNAAVEAARAGSAGKGFAVVADEVRTLAAKSAEAAKETADLIHNSIINVNRGSEITSKTAESLKIANGLAEESVKDLDRLSIMSEQSASAITEINAGIGQISEVVQSNSATAEESAASSEEMFAQSNMLNQIVGRFKLRSDIHITSSDHSVQNGGAQKAAYSNEEASGMYLSGQGSSKY